MKIGFAKIDITPPLGTPLCGQLVSYPAEGIESPLYATAMCLEQDGVEFVLVSCDVIMISNAIVDEVSQRIAKETGIDKNNVIICATHTHSGPVTQDIFGANTNNEYLEVFKNGIFESAITALKNLTEADLFVSNGELPGYAFNRRYIMTDGTVETHPLKNNPHIVKAEGPDSKDLEVLFARDKSNNVMGGTVVFGCHGTVMERENKLLSSDYPGKTVDYISKNMGDAPFLFLQGACGDICQDNPFDNSYREVGAKWSKKMGQVIGSKALELIENNSTQINDVLSIKSDTVLIPRRKINQDLIEWAENHKKIKCEVPLLSDYGTEPFDNPGNKISLENLFKTPFWANFYANEIKTLVSDYQRQPEVQFKITTVSMGSWSMVTLPCELFIEWADEIKKISPFEVTSVVELANGSNGYILTEKAFTRSGSYETKYVTSSILCPEAGKMVLESVKGLFT